MYFSGINGHKPGCHLHNMKLYSIMFTNNETEDSEDNKGHRTDPWGSLNRSLQRSDRVEPLYIDLVK